MMVPSLTSLPSLFGDLDIYLFDQLLKGRIQEGMHILDAGCGGGRNLHYLLQAGVQVYGVDQSATAIDEVKQLAGRLAPHLSSRNFTVADLSDLPYPDAHFDVVICSAVLHFARDEAHFRRIVQELWRVLKPGGMFFSRLSSSIGLETKLQQIAERHYLMPHGQVWFLADENLIREMVTDLSAELLEPLKSVLVEQERSMTTWVMRKN